MKEIYKFSSKNGHCPQCIAFGKRYWIQDKLIGGNTYEYCLMSTPTEARKKIRFKNKIELANWINGEDIEDKTKDDSLRNNAAKLIISFSTKASYRFSDRKLIEGKEGKFILYENFLAEEYMEPTQETGWFDTYAECLDMSKEILRKKKIKKEGEQLTIELK